MQQTHINQHLNNAWLKRMCHIQTGSLEIMGCRGKPPPSPWQPLTNEERERERASESSPDCTSLPAVNVDTLQSFVSVESVETCFPTVAP